MTKPHIFCIATLAFWAGTAQADPDYDSGFADGYRAGYSAGLKDRTPDTPTPDPFNGGEGILSPIPNFLAVPFDVGHGTGSIVPTQDAVPLYGDFDFDNASTWQQIYETGAAAGWPDEGVATIAIIPTDPSIAGLITAPVGTPDGPSTTTLSGDRAAFAQGLSAVRILRDAPLISGDGLQLNTP